MLGLRSEHEHVAPRHAEERLRQAVRARRRAGPRDEDPLRRRVLLAASASVSASARRSESTAAARALRSTVRLLPVFRFLTRRSLGRCPRTTETFGATSSSGTGRAGSGCVRTLERDGSGKHLDGRGNEEEDAPGLGVRVLVDGPGGRTVVVAGSKHLACHVGLTLENVEPLRGVQLVTRQADARFHPIRAVRVPGTRPSRRRRRVTSAIEAASQLPS